MALADDLAGMKAFGVESEHYTDLFVNRVLTSIRKRIAEDAGSFEAIALIIDALNNTDWDLVLDEVGEEQNKRIAYYDMLVEQEKQERLQEIVTCSHCGNQFQRKDIASFPGVIGRGFCLSCVEVVTKESSYRCLSCCKSYVSIEKPDKDWGKCWGCRTTNGPSEYRKVIAQLNRANKCKANATLTLRQWRATLDHFGSRCAYCGGIYKAMEHFIPLPLAGTTANNCVPSCPSCNSRKGDRHPDTLDDRFPVENLQRIRTWLQAQ